MKFINRLLFSTFLICSCCTSDISQKVPEFRLIKRFSNRIKDSEGINLYSYGINNSLPKDYKKTNIIANISVSYILRKKREEFISLDDARCLFVSVAESLLKEVNSDKDVRDRLEVHPFSSDRIRLFFHYKDENKVELGNGGISEIYFWDGKIQYYRYEIREYTPPTPLGKSYLVHEESYSEALEMVKTQGCLKEL